jgi:hypothetical protein
MCLTCLTSEQVSSSASTLYSVSRSSNRHVSLLRSIGMSSSNAPVRRAITSSGSRWRLRSDSSASSTVLSCLPRWPSIRRKAVGSSSKRSGWVTNAGAGGWYWPDRYPRFWFARLRAVLAGSQSSWNGGVPSSS